MSHHVTVTLPDGRPVRVDYRSEIVPVLQAISEEIAKPRSKIDYNRLAGLDLKAAAWLDDHPDRTCSWAQQRDGSCTIHD